MSAARRSRAPVWPAGTTDGRVTVNIVQAAQRAQVSRRTVYHWLETGKVEFVRTAGGRVRIFADSLFRESPPFRRTVEEQTDETRPA